MSEAEDIFNYCNAIWTYKEGQPHALLASGLHSDGYFNVNSVTKVANFRKELAEMLVEKVKKTPLHLKYQYPNVILSSSYAGIQIGQAVADVLECESVFTEKVGDSQVWTSRFDIPDKGVVWQVEDLVTTLGTVRSVTDAVMKASFISFARQNGKVIVATIVHRPSKLPVTYDDYHVISLIEKEVHNWKPEECPLCKKGSVALKPKQNWNLFKIEKE